MDFPGGSDSKEFAFLCRILGLILGKEDSLEKGMATYSIILAWRISQAEDSDNLQPMGSQSSDTTEQLTLTK